MLAGAKWSIALIDNEKSDLTDADDAARIRNHSANAASVSRTFDENTSTVTTSKQGGTEADLSLTKCLKSLSVEEREREREQGGEHLYLAVMLAYASISPDHPCLVELGSERSVVDFIAIAISRMTGQKHGRGAKGGEGEGGAEGKREEEKTA